MLRRNLRKVKPEHATKLTKSTVELPACPVTAMAGEANYVTVLWPKSVEEFSTCRAHGPKRLSQLTRRVKSADFAGKEAPNLKNRVNAVLWNFHFRWHVQNATIFQKREDPPRCPDLWFWRVP